MRISDWSSDVCSSDLFRLATFALPVYSAIGAGLFVHAQGYATAAMLLAGFTTGLIVYLTGQAVFVSVRSPLLRFLVALLFAVPAGFEIGRAHVCTPVTNAHLVCRLLLENTQKN